MKPRQPRLLEPLDALRKAIVKLRLFHEHADPPQLDVATLDAVEAALEFQFPDDVLLLFAAGIDDLRSHATIDLSRVVRLNARAKEKGLPAELVAFGAHPEGGIFYAIKREASSDDPTQVVLFDSEDKSFGGQSLRDWVQGRLEQFRELLRDGDPEQRQRAKLKPSTEIYEGFKPELIIPSTPETRVRRVKHVKFGEGEVLQEIGSAPTKKLEIKFNDQTRILLARVVEDCP